MEYLIETALLTHGLKSVTNEDIRKVWTIHTRNIVWIAEGKIIIGDMNQYLEFRKKSADLIRIDCELLEEAMLKKYSGALTASGTMAVCQKLGIPVAVTCGMGGIGDIRGEELCPDLPALVKIPVVLVSTGPKDMLEREATIHWLTEHGVTVLGSVRNYCTGYVFVGRKVKLQGIFENNCQTPMLILNEIPEEKRIGDLSILKEAVLCGKKAEAEGKYYHPAVNGRIDELTKGYSSQIQLESLLENAKFAEQM